MNSKIDPVTDPTTAAREYAEARYRGAMSYLRMDGQIDFLAGVAWAVAAAADDRELVTLAEVDRHFHDTDTIDTGDGIIIYGSPVVRTRRDLRDACRLLAALAPPDPEAR